MHEAHVKYTKKMRQIHVIHKLKLHVYFTCVKYAYNTLISCVEVTYFWGLWLSMGWGGGGGVHDIESALHVGLCDEGKHTVAAP